MTTTDLDSCQLIPAAQADVLRGGAAISDAMTASDRWAAYMDRLRADLRASGCCPCGATVRGKLAHTPNMYCHGGLA